MNKFWNAVSIICLLSMSITVYQYWLIGMMAFARFNLAFTLQLSLCCLIMIRVVVSAVIRTLNQSIIIEQEDITSIMLSMSTIVVTIIWMAYLVGS